jgi:DNA processing protein
MAQRLAKDLATCRSVISSGLARGIDSSAPKGALSSDAGANIGMLGCGMDVVYPKENIEEMTQRGAIVIELPMNTFPAPQDLPIGNRIIAAWRSLSVLVVEGAQYSGSLITARLAMEIGREAYGVPANATLP